MSAPAPSLVEVDPFDLPEWLGAGAVAWVATSSVRDAARVHGVLSDGEGTELACDLLAVDVAFPQVVLDGAGRRAVHQAWAHDQVLLADHDGRLAVVVPGTAFTADLVLEAVGRLAKALGVKRRHFSVTLRL